MTTSQAAAVTAADAGRSVRVRGAATADEVAAVLTALAAGRSGTGIDPADPGERYRRWRRERQAAIRPRA